MRRRAGLPVLPTLIIILIAVFAGVFLLAYEGGLRSRMEDNTFPGKLQINAVKAEASAVTLSVQNFGDDEVNVVGGRYSR